ncbi:hypothetical protein LCGC14_2846950 [marine sediment metagenome]|uniref:Uncharacterized protein n=1 Tax=marine sediment metagenome TaxID=412755 RepID=A0A0F8YW96_9ZZZZ
MSSALRLALLLLLVLGISYIAWGPGRTYAPFVDSETGTMELQTGAWGPIPATVDIDPDTLNPKSEGNYVMAYIELPDGYDVGDIDLSTVTLRVAGTVGPDCFEPSAADFVPAELSPTEVGDHDSDGIADRMVKFSRPDVLDLIEGKTMDSLVTLVVSGQLLPSGTTFEGCDTIDPPEPATSTEATPAPMPVAQPAPAPAPEPTVEPEPTPERNAGAGANGGP